MFIPSHIRHSASPICEPQQGIVLLEVNLNLLWKWRESKDYVLLEDKRDRDKQNGVFMCSFAVPMCFCCISNIQWRKNSKYNWNQCQTDSSHAYRSCTRRRRSAFLVSLCCCHWRTFDSQPWEAKERNAFKALWRCHWFLFVLRAWQI